MEEKKNSQLCSICYNPHKLTDKDAGTEREIRRLCLRCYDREMELGRKEG